MWQWNDNVRPTCLSAGKTCCPSETGLLQVSVNYIDLSNILGVLEKKHETRKSVSAKYISTIIM